MREVPALQVHPHTWRGFFIHIATIVLGLFIAVGIDRTVDFFYHRYLCAELEQQIREVFKYNLESDRRSLHALRLGRDYLSDLRTAIVARLKKQANPPPTPDASRFGAFVIFSALAPFEVAKQNGTAALLPTERLRLYNRIAFALELLRLTQQDFNHAVDALAAFHVRYVDQRGSVEAGERIPGPSLEALSPPELADYLAVVATASKEHDILSSRIRLVDFEAREILNGIPSETALIGRMREVRGVNGREPEPPAP